VTTPAPRDEDAPVFDILRRHLVAVATAAYDNTHDLPGVADEVTTIAGWVCDETLGDRRFTRAYPELAEDPTEEQLGALKRLEWSADDAAVVFVTGHGVVRDDTHWLLLKTSDPLRLRSTAVRTGDLLGWLADTDVEHLLVILDLCHAGKTASDVVRFTESLPRTWLVLAAVSKGELATTGALTGAVADFLEELGSPVGEQYDHGPYLRFDQFIAAVQDRLGDAQRLTLVEPALPQLGASPCLPNPRWQPDDLAAVQARRRDLALRPADLLAHWGPRSRGVAQDADPGWLFTGRVELMQELIAAATGDPAVLLVTGGAGSGKSAALARLVTLSDPAFLAANADNVQRIADDLRPPVGAVDVAVLATGKLPHQVLAQITAALGVPEPADTQSLDARLDAWRRWLRDHHKPVTVVVDALDEATDPHGLLSTVLARLDHDVNSQLRLIVGVRSPGTTQDTTGADTTGADTTGADTTGADTTVPLRGGRPLADLAEQALHADRVRVDEPPWWEQSDLAEYATDLLRHTPGSPYQQAPADLIARIGLALARHSGTSFLVARIAATSLAGRPDPVDPDDPGWLAAVRDGVVGVFRDDLHRRLTTDEDRVRAVHLLRAVAFARGRGLPWRDLWPRFANAVADGDAYYGDHDIAWLLQSPMGGYLVTDHEDGVTVYRLFHDELRTTLRERWRELLDTAGSRP
jgi:hypothetical protein